MSRSLVVMAAGLGSRYGGVKQMEPVGPNGEILLDYAVYDALLAGFDRIVFIIRQDIEDDVREYVEPTIAKHCNVQYVHQSISAIPAGCSLTTGRIKPWGIAHAVLQCHQVLTDSFGVINADDFYGGEAFVLLTDLLEEVERSGEESMTIGLVGYRLGQTLSDYGHVTHGIIETDPAGCVMAIRERKRIQRLSNAIGYDLNGQWRALNPEAPVSMNMWAFHPGFLEKLVVGFREFLSTPKADMLSAEYLLPEVVGDLLESKQLTARMKMTSARWFGMTYPEDRPLVRDRIRKLIQNGTYPANLWQSENGTA